MNKHIKGVLLVVSILALLIGTRDTPCLDAVDLADAPGVEPLTGAQVEPTSTPAPEGDASDADRPTVFESSQAGQAAPSWEEPVGDVDPGSIPSLEERNAILDRVNQGPVLLRSEGDVGVDPVPGTESIIGPGEEQDDALNRVNRGAPLLAEGDKEASDGPAPGTESDIGYRETRDDVLGRVNRGAPELPANDDSVNEGPEPGSESDTEQRFSLGWIWTRFVQTLRNWWHELRTWFDRQVTHAFEYPAS
jgi:hypothetical protein